MNDSSKPPNNKQNPSEGKALSIKKFVQGSFELSAGYSGKDIWLTQKQIADLLGLTVPTVSRHVENVRDSGILDTNAVIALFTITASDGKNYEVEHYNLEVVMTIAFRANMKGENSVRIKAFRQWATGIIRRYLTGELRSGEKHVYSQVKDCIALCSDYDGNSSTCRDYFATIQNKLLFAITDQTAPEIIYHRVDAEKPNMGLVSWHGDTIHKADVTVAKNYLSPEELRRLNRITEALLIVADDFNERVEAGEKITMDNWIESVDLQVVTLRMKVLHGKGGISREDAEKTAHREYELFKRALKDGK